MARFLHKSGTRAVQLDTNLMFGFLKNLLRRPSEETVESSPADFHQAAASGPRYHPEASAPRQPAPQPNGKGLELPVQVIVDSLPLELQPRVRMQRTGNLTITVPLEKVLAQLSRGAVKISFGELRQAVPEVFTSENDRDRVLVALPLSEILSRLSPNLISRRRVQRQVHVPDDISSPFEDEGNGLAISGANKPEPAAVPPPPRQTAPPPPASAPSRGTLASAPTPPPPGTMPQAPGHRFNLKSAPTPPAPSAAPPSMPQTPAPAAAPAGPIPFQAPRPAPKPPAPTGARTEPIPMSGGRPDRSQAAVTNQVPAFQPKQAVPKPTLAPPVSPHAPVRPATPASPALQPQTRNTPAPAGPFAPKAAPRVESPVSHAFQAAAVPAAPALPAAAPAPEQATPPPAPTKPVAAPECLAITVTALAENWPDPVRKELVDLNLVDARVALPVHAAEQGLKQGRIAFSWKTIRGWIKPSAQPSSSAHDGTVLELPLKVVAPLFLARQKDAAKPQQKVMIDEDIPNLFFGFPQTEGAVPVAQATARPADTNFYVWDDAHDMVKVHEAETKRGPTPGTKFVAKYATPNEVVSRTAGLDGVSGALIALPDGLMVANRLPPDVNADTLAAFLPQIFGKVSQCTKELRMGDLNNLNFTVGNVPWKIFRVNSIFFAAFGRAGEPLPTAQLAALAAELDHNPK